MTEHIAQMGPMLILAGLVAGWMAETVLRAGGYGFTTDMVIGLVGSVVAGTAVWLLALTHDLGAAGRGSPSEDRDLGGTPLKAHEDSWSAT
jgi:hypothetical protein